MKKITIPVDSLQPGTSIEIAYIKKEQTEPVGWPKPWFGGANAPWAVPIDADLKQHPKNTDLVRQFKLMCDGTINLNTHRWAIAVHYYDSNTPMSTLQVERPQWCNMESGQQIPWNPSWEHGDDGDSFTTVIDPKTGMCFLIWKTHYDKSTNRIICGTANIVKATAESSPLNPNADIWTKINGFIPSRGGGISLPHMLVTREEMEAGEINHCLAAALPNPSRGTRVAPATKNIGQTGSPGTGRLGTGFRFAFDITESDVTRWADRFSGPRRKYAFAIGKAATDYGFIIVDNGGNRERKIGSVYFEHDVSAGWDEMDFPKNVAQGMLTSLLKPNMGKLYFIEEPIMENRNDVAMYRNIEYPDR